MPLAHVGEPITLRFRLTDQDGTAVDTQGAAEVAIVYLRPDGTEGEWAADAGATQGDVEYECTTNDLNAAGHWRLRARVDDFYSQPLATLQVDDP